MKCKVKICGVTRIADAQLAFELGAFAIGFILCPSPRRVSLSKATQIANSLPQPMLRIGVFKDPQLKDIEIAARCRAINGIQLHGNESPQLVQSVRAAFPDFYLLKRLSPESAHQQELFSCDAILVEPNKTPKASISVLSQETRNLVSRPLFVAGGITPENVLSIIDQTRPDGVDLASGIEERPGIKDAHKMQTLFSKLQPSEVRP
jgi:phosphoribosylanthranilate isomerase